MKPAPFFALLAALVALGCASVNEAHRNVVVEYEDRGGLSAREYAELEQDFEASDQWADSIEVVR